MVHGTSDVLDSKGLSVLDYFLLLWYPINGRLL
jgi:hypothetical protein